MQVSREWGLGDGRQVVGWFLVGVVGFGAWVVFRQVGWLLVSGVSLVSGAIWLHTAWLGRERLWYQLLAMVPLNDQTRALDLGCGSGPLHQLETRLPVGGQVTGVVPVNRAARCPALMSRWQAANLTDRVTVQAADLRDLPWRPNQFNLVVSSLALHRVQPRAGRLQALQELNRVLAPGGRVLIMDWGFACAEYREALQRLGYQDIQVTGTGYHGWWGGPWLPTLTLTAVKPHEGTLVS